MSDFFAGVNGARFPDVVMNQGPLPSMGGLPAPLHDTADARINYNSSLLGNLDPYAYGEPGYLSSQTGYLNIPHKIQKIVPYLYIPQPDGTGSFQLCHPIDDGDVAFVMRLDRNSEVCTGLSNRVMQRAGLGTAIDPMINLPTLNYILAGIQLSTQLAATRVKWDNLCHYLDKERFSGDHERQYNYEDLKHIVRNLIRPFGVAHGSEKQGGTHEGSLSPATWPVNFVISLTLDGKEANVVNVWNSHDIEAGNDLVFRLKCVPLPDNRRYVLNHYGKALAEKKFSDNLIAQINEAQQRRITHVWQLVPDIFSLSMDAEQEALFNGGFDGLPLGFNPPLPLPCWQEEGYWHIARAQVHSRTYGVHDYFCNDMANNLRTAHIDVTFQPAFLAIPYRDHAHQNGAAVLTQVGPGGIPRNVHNVIGDPMERSSNLKRGWNQMLSIEMAAPHFSTPGSSMDTQNQGSLSVFGDSSSITSRLSGMGSRHQFLKRHVAFMPPVLEEQARVRSRKETPSESRPEEASITPMQGSFRGTEAQGSTREAIDNGALSTLRETASSTAQAMEIPTTEAPAAFTISKPGIKSSKRPSGRGKGVIGAVLGADGSVTHEQSRML